MSSSFVNKIIPLLDRVLVQKSPSIDKIGNIFIPTDSSLAKLNQGEVVAVGKGHRTPNGTFIPLSVKKGDKILVSEYGGQEVTFNGQSYNLYREDDIMAILP